MKKTTVLLVEDQKQIGEALQNALLQQNDFFLIGQAEQESDAADLLQKFQPAVVIISLPMLLRYCEGLVRTVSALPRKDWPLLLITAAASCPPGLDELYVTGLPHLFYQGSDGRYHVEEIIKCLQSIRRNAQAFAKSPGKQWCQKEIDKQARLSDFASELSAMGITCRLLGHMYLIESVSQAMDALPGVPDVTRLYQRIAIDFHTQPCNVERAIRTAIKGAWSGADRVRLSEHYTQALSRRKGAPTNKDFIVFFAKKYA